MAIDRREFLKRSGIGLGIFAGLKASSDICMDLYKDYIIDEIYNELPNHIHPIEVTGEIISDKSRKRKIIGGGYGIILDSRYITTAHIIHPNDVGNIENKKVKLYGYELEELVCNTKNDVAIYDLHRDLKNKFKIPNFPCKPTTKMSLGDKVYILGNPFLEGENIREMTISRLEGWNGIEKEMGAGKRNSFFGISDTVIPGDSGTPVVNENYELLGLTAIHYENSLGYVKKIGEFTKEMRSEEPLEKCINSLKKFIENLSSRM